MYLKKKQILDRRRLFEIIQIGTETDAASRGFDIVLVVNIIVNIAVMFMQTFQVFAPIQGLLDVLENMTVALFSAEYLARIYTADYLFPGESRPKAVIRFILSPDGIIELLAILPVFFLSGFIIFRMLRVVRIFHLFRINASLDSFSVIWMVIYEKKNQILSSVFIILVLMLASSLCMYSVEHDAQPEVFRNAFSGIWWSVSTLLTVGYGDIYPVTVLGRAMAIVIAFLGVGAVAIPTGIISAGFVEQYTRAQNSSVTEEINLQTVVVDIDSRWIGMSVNEIEEVYHIIVLVVKRGNVTILPNDEYRVHLKDAMAVYHKSI